MKTIRTKVASSFPQLRSREFFTETFDFQSGLGDSAWLLYGLARSIKPQVLRGDRFCSGANPPVSVWFWRCGRNGGGKLYAIDPHSSTAWNDTNSVDTFAIITENLRKSGAEDFVEIVRKTSDEAAKGWKHKIDLIFIDGDHTYEGVKRDWELFLPHLSELGVVVFHDTLWDLRPDKKLARTDMGVPRFVEELLRAARLSGHHHRPELLRRDSHPAPHRWCRARPDHAECTSAAFTSKSDLRREAWLRQDKRMSRPVKIVQKIVSPFAGVINRGRLGFPRYFFEGAGGIGDDLMCTAWFSGNWKKGATAASPL